MKKLFASLVVSLLLAAGLVAATSSSPSQAACPYTNCIATRVNLGAPVSTVRNRPVRIGARVVATRGNARPRGALVITVRGPGVNRTVTYPNYNGRVVTFTQRFPRVATYRITARFNAPSTSAFRDSSAARNIRVRRR